MEGMGAVQLELHLIDTPHERLRVSDPTTHARLLSSLVEYGQQSPVWVIEASDRYVLIDGYCRVAVLRTAQVDTVLALILAMSEVDALLMSYVMAAGRRRSALEEGWLIARLSSEHGLSGSQIAARLGRSKSWVSRRLGLVRDLPGDVQDLVRNGVIGAHGASKYLLPLARANPRDSEVLAGSLAKLGRVSDRQLAWLYGHWRGGDREQRRMVVEQPDLVIRMQQAVERPPELKGPGRVAEQVEDKLDWIASLCWQTRRMLRSCDQSTLDERATGGIKECWQRVEQAVEALRRPMSEVVGCDD